MEDYTFDSKRQETLVRLIRYLSRKGVNVYLVLSPYHPSLFAKIKLYRPVYEAVENQIREIGHLTNARVLGAFDPALSGCVGGEFIDPIHPAVACMERILKKHR